MPAPLPRFYDEFAEWWPLFSPPSDYEAEAADLLPRLNRQFDVVLIHDAIMYAIEPADVLATLRTAALHCCPGGTVAVLPDCVRETFTAETDCGGHDGEDGRAFRYLEWRWDPDPADDTYIVDYAFVLRAPDGTLTVAHDSHVEGLFSRARWLQWFTGGGLSAHNSLDAWERDVFIATPLLPNGGITPTEIQESRRQLS